jgi:hypothetical protein
MAGTTPKKKRERRKGGKQQRRSFTRSAPDGASKVAKYTALVHALLLGFQSCYSCSSSFAIAIAPYTQAATARTLLLPILAVPASLLPQPTFLLALSILSHIVLHSTYFPLYIPYLLCPFTSCLLLGLVSRLPSVIISITSIAIS